jgi:hypothetical protein
MSNALVVGYDDATDTGVSGQSSGYEVDLLAY